MAVPDNFSPVEHLQDTFRRTLNPEVREWFRDVGPADWDPDINTPRGSLRHACTHADSDPITVTLLRHFLFDFIVRQRFKQPVYGIPISSFQEQRKFRPQILLYFVEDASDVDPEFEPVSGEISFRLMNHSSDTITEAIATTYATRIRSAFATAGGFVWRKGKRMCTYTDWGKGYQLQLLCRDVAEGRRVIEQILDIQTDTPDWSKMNASENEAPSEAYPTLPPLERVYGKSRRAPRRRPIADVRFQYAVLHVHGLNAPICLCDRSGVWSNPLVA